MDAERQPLSPGLGLTAVRERLTRARWIWRWSEGLARGLLWSGAALAALLVLGALDNLFALPGVLRLALGLAWLACAVVTLCAWVLRPGLRRPSDEAVAVYVERRMGERENLLINAVQLGARPEEQLAGAAVSMVGRVVAEAATRAGALDLSTLWESRRLRRLGAMACAAALLILAYGLFLPAYALNALSRYARPLSGIPPLSRVMVVAAPAGEVEVVAGDRLVVHALATAREGALPDAAAVSAELDGAERRFAMLPAEPEPALAQAAGRPARAAGFTYEFTRINLPFTFHIAAGDGVSAPCRVKVRERPAVENLLALLTPPAYTALPAVQEPVPGGVLHALPGTRAALSFKPTTPLAGGTLKAPAVQAPLEPAEEGRWKTAFGIEKEGAWSLALNSTAGARADPAFEGQVLLRTDALPAVAFENPSLNLPAAPGTTVPLTVRAEDDYGLQELRLIVQRWEADGTGGKPAEIVTLKAWTHPVPGPKEEKELYPLRLDPARFVSGAAYAVFAEAGDHAPGARRIRRSAPFLIRILAPGQIPLPEDAGLKTLLEQLQKLIEMQTKARAKTQNAREFMAELLGNRQFPVRCQALAAEQTAIRADARKAAGSAPAAPDTRPAGRITAELRALAEGPMTRVLNEVELARKAAGEKAGPAPLVESVEKTQGEILNRLTALLGTVADGEKRSKTPDLGLKDDQDSKRLRDALSELKDKLEKFIPAEKKAIQSLEELGKKDPNDLTDEEKQRLGELAKEEQDWAKYFKEKFTDLSKVPDQDFSNSGLAKELNEVFQEVQKAADALAGKHIEIAVANEEAGLELAQKLETNLERWLPNTPDTLKWSMEEPKGEFDVPLADLPKELEDIIGELLDDENKMTEDVQDVSSSFLDSMDKGAGWGATDGNISNMSAKGVTGNQQPNDHEIGGRSGEGRSGKSTGQFVEQTAEGKGGKQTPTRTTPDPYEQGEVKDTSKDPVGGSTGGGKESGAAGLGLRGTPPPETAKKLERLKDTQADLRQAAEKVTTQLHAYHLPSGDMEEAVRRMKAIESNLQTGRGFNLRQAHSQVMDSLKEARTVVGFQAEVDKEHSRPLPKYVRQEILSGMQQKPPQGYQDLLEAYYKSLVERDK